METLLTISVYAFILILLVVIGFFITWLVGKIIKKQGPTKTGKIGMIIAASFLALSVITISISATKISSDEANTEKINKQKDNNFKSASEKFTRTYLSAGGKMEEVGTSEYKYWGDKIDDSDSSDDFDVNEVVADAVAYNSAKISDANNELDVLKKSLNKMKTNDTGKYDTKGYEKAYLRIKKLGSFVSYPTGSYLDFNDKMTKLDDAVNESYDWMTE
ncbi:hypothetical protein [Companilactobacillus nantensis]|uniref:hypothetical protein n=1 Tax=Companilactobacillus nantensis TaxID=305793 RepID=UPI00070FE6C1|nr:hypothetical protein [Companilactobacillus nantensis]GEO65174.1 hypothetical protein LNA01_23570 [Companilactobacillus nantensis]